MRRQRREIVKNWQTIARDDLGKKKSRNSNIGVPGRKFNAHLFLI